MGIYRFKGRNADFVIEFEHHFRRKPELNVSEVDAVFQESGGKKGALNTTASKAIIKEAAVQKKPVYYGDTYGQFIMVFLLACANRFCSFFRIPFFW